MSNCDEQQEQEATRIITPRCDDRFCAESVVAHTLCHVQLSSIISRIVDKFTNLMRNASARMRNLNRIVCRLRTDRLSKLKWIQTIVRHGAISSMPSGDKNDFHMRFFFSATASRLNSLWRLSIFDRLAMQRRDAHAMTSSTNRKPRRNDSLFI